mgnify:CR=1 FL=1
MGTLSRAESVKDHFLAGRTRSIKFSSMVEAFDVQIPPWGNLDRAYHKSKSKNAGPYRVRTAFENLAAKVAALFRARELTCTVSYLAKGKLSRLIYISHALRDYSRLTNPVDQHPLVGQLQLCSFTSVGTL